MKYTVRLKSNKDFVGLYKKGKFIAGRCTVIYCRKNGRNFNRIGISVSKKIGGAVQRNRAKRVIRQAYRETEELFPKGLDIVIAARGDAVTCKSYHITSFIRKKAVPFIKNSFGMGQAKEKE